MSTSEKVKALKEFGWSDELIDAFFRDDPEPQYYAATEIILTEEHNDVSSITINLDNSSTHKDMSFK